MEAKIARFGKEMGMPDGHVVSMLQKYVYAFLNVHNHPPTFWKLVEQQQEKNPSLAEFLG